MITRGTTPYHSFVLPFSVEQIKALYITYLQNGEVVLERNLSEIELHNLFADSNGFIIDENQGDYLPENDAALEEDAQIYSQATVHLTQDETLAFKFWPAAEKNVAVIQVRALTIDDEAFASEPVHERIYGVLKDGVIQTMEKNRVFTVNFNSSSNTKKVHFNKIDQTLKNIKMDAGSQPVEDLYYDEVIIYDGGGVEGYGDN